MDYDELLDAIDRQIITAPPFALGGYTRFLQALRAVVELHKPQEITLPNGEWGTNCVECDGYFYPCPTIQAIEKELN